MNRDSWRKIDQLAKKALSLPTLDRPSFYKQIQGEEPEVAHQVKLMMDAVKGLDGFLEEPIQPQCFNLDYSDYSIENYRLLEKIGEGGMGIVYLAEQLSPLRRRVAMKIVRSEIRDDKSLARFELENQALAQMNHPNITRILESGVTRRGIPYFTMEYLIGVPITEYCRKKRLGIEQRLVMFEKVCKAVQHAHHKGIIHRDLKPSNILVTEVDGEPVPKIIDFGIAKVVSNSFSSSLALLTKKGSLLGTPCYMSPEQADHNCLELDARSDIYSLGTILYELLCDQTVFDLERLSVLQLSQLLRVICFEEPIIPSQRLKNCLLTGGADLPINYKVVKGDLDCITLKALEKLPSRRYHSAAELGEDVIRALDKQPILASSWSFGYLLRKSCQKRFSTIFQLNWKIMWTISNALLTIVITLGLVNGNCRQTTGIEVAKTAEQPVVSPAEMAIDEQVNDLSDWDSRPEVKAPMAMKLAKDYLALGVYSKAEALMRLALSYQVSIDGGWGDKSIEHGLVLVDLLVDKGLYFEAKQVLEPMMTNQLDTVDPMQARSVRIQYDKVLLGLKKDYGQESSSS